MYNLKNFLKMSFSFAFLGDFILIYAFYNKFFLEKLSNQSAIIWILIIIRISKIIFDIPTGILADIWSRRNILIVGQIARIFACLLWILFPTLQFFLIGGILWGLAMSCIYYHTEAYFFDALKSLKEENLFSKIIGKFYAIQNISIALAAFLAGYLFNYRGYKIISGLTIFVILISILMLLKMPDIKIKKDKKSILKEKNPLHIFKLFIDIINNPMIFRLLILSAIFDSLFIVFLDLNTIIMSTSNFQGKYISYIVGGIGGIRILTNYFSGYTIRHFSIKKIMSYLLIILIIILLFSGIDPFFLIGGIGFYLCVYPFFDNSLKTKIQNKIDSQTRATVLSFASLFTSLFAISADLIVGQIAKEISYRASIMCLCAILIIALSLIRNLTRIYRINAKILKFFQCNKNSC